MRDFQILKRKNVSVFWLINHQFEISRQISTPALPFPFFTCRNLYTVGFHDVGFGPYCFKPQWSCRCTRSNVIYFGLRHNSTFALLTIVCLSELAIRKGVRHCLLVVIINYRNAKCIRVCGMANVLVINCFLPPGYAKIISASSKSKLLFDEATIDCVRRRTYYKVFEKYPVHRYGKIKYCSVCIK